MKKLEELTEAEIATLSKKTNDWIASEEGRKEIAAALQNATKTCRQLEQSRKMRPEDWHQPMTI